jgi:YspA, cpYpsA-related SLOG family
MRVLICGDRNWNNLAVIERVLSEYVPEVSIIIEGEARGADTLGRIAAIKLGISVLRVPAKWDKYGKGAGPIRNQEMLEFRPDIVLAFHRDIENSRGTKDMVNRAMAANIPVRIIRE